jgi:hypothetical protein
MAYAALLEVLFGHIAKERSADINVLATRDVESAFQIGFEMLLWTRLSMFAFNVVFCVLSSHVAHGASPAYGSSRFLLSLILQPLLAFSPPAPRLEDAASGSRQSAQPTVYTVMFGS